MRKINAKMGLAAVLLSMGISLAACNDDRPGRWGDHDHSGRHHQHDHDRDDGHRGY